MNGHVSGTPNGQRKKGGEPTHFQLLALSAAAALNKISSGSIINLFIVCLRCLSVSIRKRCYIISRLKTAAFFTTTMFFMMFASSVRFVTITPIIFGSFAKYDSYC